MNKRERLLVLMTQIQKKNFIKGKEVWFFPLDENTGVKGYLGTGNVMFVGLNPSFGHFPSRGDKFLYKNLRKFSLQNAHLTDLVKQRLDNKQVNKKKIFEELLPENLKWLQKEVDILGTTRIVALGQKTFDYLQDNEYLRPLLCTKFLHHYAWVMRYPSRYRKNKNTFEARLQEIKAELSWPQRSEARRRKRDGKLV